MSSFSVKIKCASCNRNKSKELYSKTSIAKLQASQRQKARDPNTPVRPINCTACTVGGRDELQCFHCRKTMALEKFNKTQRKKNDYALCQDCSQDKIDREPDFEKEVEEHEIIEEIRRSELSSYSFHSSKASSAPRSRLGSASSRVETDTHPGSNANWFEGNDDIRLSSTLSSSGYSSTDTRPKTGTGWDGFAGVNRSGTRSGGGSNAGFAKQNAVARNPFEKANAQYQREQKRLQEQDEVVRDESDESEEDEDPY